ncbi:MAG: FG-GAP-like repeat-containing protein [candidate division Zixibacteria bacterium]
MAISVSVWLLMLLHSCTVAVEASPPNPSSFVRVATSPIVSDGGWSFDASWADYDGDNYPNLFVCDDNFGSITDVYYLYHNNGDGTFTRMTNGEIASDNEPSHAAAWADHDHDGDLDLYFASYDPYSENNPAFLRNELFRNKGNGNNWIIIKPVGMSMDSLATWGTAALKP